MAASPVRLEVGGEVARLLLDAPPGNVMDDRFFDAFLEIAEEELPALDCRALLVMGAGRNFSSGAAVDGLVRRTGGGAEALGFFRRMAFAVDSLSRLSYPTVAAVSGACLGSGLELALACTTRVATDVAVFSLPEVEFGLIPGCGGARKLPGLAGLGNAIDLMLTGRMIGAGEALQTGIVDLVVPRKRLLEAAMAAAKRIGKERAVI